MRLAQWPLPYRRVRSSSSPLHGKHAEQSSPDSLSHLAANAHTSTRARRQYDDNDDDDYRRMDCVRSNLMWWWFGAQHCVCILICAHKWRAHMLALRFGFRTSFWVASARNPLECAESSSRVPCALAIVLSLIERHTSSVVCVLACARERSHRPFASVQKINKRDESDDVLRLSAKAAAIRIGCASDACTSEKC